MQTGSSGTLIGWKSGQTTFVPLWDRMEGAWLRTQVWNRVSSVRRLVDYKLLLSVDITFIKMTYSWALEQFAFLNVVL